MSPITSDCDARCAPQVLLQSQRLQQSGTLDTPLRRQLWGVQKMRDAAALESYGRGGSTIDMV